jgi:hypothetical protein
MLQLVRLKFGQIEDLDYIIAIHKSYHKSQTHKLKNFHHANNQDEHSILNGNSQYLLHNAHCLQPNWTQIRTIKNYNAQCMFIACKSQMTKFLMKTFVGKCLFESDECLC